MLRPERRDRVNVGTVLVVLVVIGAVLGWAIYDDQNTVAVRQVPTETITAPKAADTSAPTDATTK